jgi:hypothetical protein
MKYILILIIIGAIGYGIYISKPAEGPSDTIPVQVVENRDGVIAYISKNISTLSPKKAEVGGTFYVTNITLDAGTGEVEYEDGHNAYTATFAYSFDAADNIVISNFEIVE